MGRLPWSGGIEEHLLPHPLAPQTHSTALLGNKFRSHKHTYTHRADKHCGLVGRRVASKHGVLISSVSKVGSISRIKMERNGT